MAIEAALERSRITADQVQYVQVQYVVMGQVLTAGVGQNPARQAAVTAGIPTEVLPPP